MSGSRFGDIDQIIERFARFARARRSASPTEADENPAEIERLEQALAEERDRAAELQRTIDALNFRIDVLEKGYTTQLDDARRRLEDAERSLAERDGQLADVSARHDAAAESLAGVRSELQRVTAQRDKLRRQIDGDPEPDETEDGDLPEGTINRLLAAASRPRVRRGTVDEVQEEAPGDLLAPEMLLRKKDADDAPQS